ncbi:MAG TPA: SWIM zinc finger family protein, partial [Kineosporiaceae bacterium]
MAVVTLTQDEIALRDLVGTQPLLRGRVLARNGGVQAVARSRDLGRVVGTVRDDDGSFQVAVNVRQGADGRLVGIDGWCECGRAVPCAHAVALLLAGTPA